MQHYKITSIKIKGNEAVVIDSASFIHGEGGPTHLKKEDGKWLIDQAE